MRNYCRVMGRDASRPFSFQINTGGTTFNTTLNLTGHILLGLGIASSLLLYMWLEALDGGDSYGYGYGDDGGGYDRRKKVKKGLKIRWEPELDFSWSML